MLCRDRPGLPVQAPSQHATDGVRARGAPLVPGAKAVAASLDSQIATCQKGISCGDGGLVVWLVQNPMFGAASRSAKCLGTPPAVVAGPSFRGE